MTNDRILRLTDQLPALNVEALLITELNNVRYLTGFTGDSSYLLLSTDRAIILSDRRYEEQLASECPGFELAIRGPEKLLPQLCRETLLASGFKRIGVEEEHVSAAMLRRMRESLSDLELVGTTDAVEQLRCCKDASEIAVLRRAIKLAEDSFARTLQEVTPDWTEQQVAWRLEHYVREGGGEKLGFPAIVAVGAGAALPHYRSGRKRIGDQPLLLIDWGANLEGYISDLTRTVWTGHVSEELKRIHAIVLAAHDAAIEAIRPGTKFELVDKAAREVIEQSGYGDRFSHGLGHGIGLQVHEFPRMAAGQTGELRQGMVVTVEPGIYIPGLGGVRIEDDCLVTQSGCEVLSKLPIDQQIFG